MPSDPPTPDRTQRLLDLLAFLISHHFPVSRGQIWERVVGYRRKLDEEVDEASVRRTFERDKRALLEMGFPLETVEVRGNEPDEQLLYRLRARDFHLPYLRLLEEDAGATRPKPPSTPTASIEPGRVLRAAEPLHRLAENPALPFHAEARSALRKLTFDLTSDPEELFGAAPLIVPADDASTRERVPELARAIRERRVIRFSYHGLSRPEPTRREVEPWALLHRQNRWYLLGHDRERGERRLFRVSRILELEPPAATDRAAAFVPPELEPSEWRAAHAWDLPGMEEPAIRVELRFHFPRSLWAEQTRAGELVRWESGGAAIRRFAVRTPEPFLRWLLGQMGEAEIVLPANGATSEEVRALTRDLEAMRRRVIEANPRIFRAEEDGPVGAVGDVPDLGSDPDSLRDAEDGA